MKNSKRAFLHSLIALLLCVSMLIGTTFAWFTDSVTSSKNIITSGNLDLEMYWTDNLNSGVWYNVEDGAHNTIFNYDNWEPGYTEVKYIKLVNAGKLALNYELTLTPQGSVGKLAEVINVFYANNGVNIDSRDDLSSLNSIGFLKSVLNGGATASGTLLAADQQSPLHDSGEIIITIAMEMITTAGNDYQNETIGDGFSITALATQCAFEEDSFGSDYDINAELPEILTSGKASVSVTPDNGKVPAGGVTIAGDGISATVPAGVILEDGAEKLTLTVTPLEKTTSDITVVNKEILIPVDVHIDGVAETNTTPIIIELGAIMPKYLNMGNYTLIHVEDGVNNSMTYVEQSGTLNAHNQFKYDSDTGEVTVCLASFSEVAVVADTVNEWKGVVAEKFSGGTGTEADPYIISNADQLAYMNFCVSNENANYGNKYYKLISDINLGGSDAKNTAGEDIDFYPIGYLKNGTGTNKAGENTWYTYGGSFSGTFDGAGHSITGIYQNTWDMDGNYDNGYWNAAMGLFGYVNGGTVKNLTINDFYSEGEFAPTGCITAYAAGKAVFENIAITNSHPQTYNTGVAGIVGWDNGGDTEDEASNFTFKNITVDATNTISALWGSWDVAAAGIMGYLGKYSKANLDNCHLSATIDVYNDVCGNYQYYWYRYCGMVIGTVDKTLENGSLDLSNITATNCTVNFGDRHEYYYCEFVKNSIASYTHDYQFSRVPHDELNMDETPVTCNHDHKSSGYEEKDINGDGIVDSDVLKEDKQAVYIPFRQLFGGYGWGVDGVDLGEYENIEISDDTKADEKFESKFTNNYLYRVGNGNTVSVGSLFKAKDGKDINSSGVYVTIDKVNEDLNVSGTFTANTTDWTKGTIQFSGTGVVKVTIQDYKFCAPTTIHLEVVDAVNATSATSATKNNVVLLNDCGFSSLEVSGGYTLYGNGFTMTCGSDSAALDMGYSFVTLNNGTLDNVQIVCPNFDYAALYKGNLTSNENRSETTDKTRYYNAKSGVMASGNSQILNSRISGGRASLNVSGGNVVVDNSRIELGAVASVLVGSANSLTLRDVTLVQKPTASTYDAEKTLMGFSVLYLCDSEGKATPTTLEGSFVQQAWIDENDSGYVPSAGKDIVTTVLKKTDYLHDIDGDGKNESLNLGFAYMPEDTKNTVKKPDNITDNRTDKAAIPYEMKDVQVEISLLSTTVYVYSYKNTNGTVESFKTETEYKPNKYSDIITVNYSDTADGLTMGKSYGTDGWVYELNVDLDKLSGYAVDFNKLSMMVNGVTVTDIKVNGSAKPTTPVAVAAGGTIYTLTATINDKEYTAAYKVTGTETSKESPSLVASNYEAGLCVASSYGGTWHGAAPALEGIQIKYWSVAEKQYKTINLSDYTPTTAGKQNGTNTTWTYSPDNGDFTLTLTGGQVHSGNSVYAMPVVCDGKLYFVPASSKGLVNTGNSARTIPVSYSFKDNNNGDVLTFSHTWSVAENKDAQYNYNDFCNGTLTKLEASGSSGGGTCLAEGTLITLADGSKQAVENLRKGDCVMAYDHLTGKVCSNKVIIVVKTNSNFYKNTFVFDDGTKLETINEHGIYDLELNKYVNITNDNGSEFIGHTFAAIDSKGNISVKKLIDVVSEYTNGYKYDIVTEHTLNYVAEDTLSVTHVLVDIINSFDFDDNMLFDYEKMQKDIEKYGLYTYDEWEAYADISVFEEYNIPVMKVGVSKGLFTKDYIIYLINTYVLDESVQITD